MVEEIPTKSGEKEAASATLRMPHEIFMRNGQVVRPSSDYKVNHKRA